MVMHKYKKHIKHNGNKRNPEAVLARIVTSVFVDASGPIVIAVGGPGGTGKSTLAMSLAGKLSDAVVLTLDDYKTARELRASRNIYGPHPEANEILMIRSHLESIKTGDSFNKPVYCSQMGEASSTEVFRSARFVVVDGEISTYKEFRDLVDFSIFVDSDWQTQLNTRIERDIEERNYSADKAISTFLHSNLREFSEYGADSKCWADVHIYCHNDYRLEIESIAEEHYSHFDAILSAEMRPLDLGGLIVPVATPFDDELNIDEKALIAHLEFLVEHGVTRIMVNGTTAEFFSLLPEERKLLLAVSTRYFPGLIFFNTGSDSLEQAKLAAHWAEDYGADAIIAMAPYYYADAEAQQLVDFFNEIAGSVELPMLLYNFVKHTNNAITPKMARQIKQIGIKDSSGDRTLIGATDHYFSGTSRSMVEGYQDGACGFVSAQANHIPDLYVELERLLLADNIDSAMKLQEQIRKVCDGASKPNEIVAIKTRLSKIIPGYSATARLPIA